jgi:hypothetical protein
MDQKVQAKNIQRHVTQQPTNHTQNKDHQKFYLTSKLLKKEELQ